MYKLELFKDGKKTRELLFLDNEVELMEAYRLENHWNGGTSKVWKLIIDNDIEVKEEIKK